MQSSIQRTMHDMHLSALILQPLNSGRSSDVPKVAKFLSGAQLPE